MVHAYMRVSGRGAMRGLGGAPDKFGPPMAPKHPQLRVSSADRVRPAPGLRLRAKTPIRNVLPRGRPPDGEASP
jgi:hypothetical protein